MIQRAEKKIAGLRWAIGLSTFLAIMKGGGGFFCSSATLLASALDSLMDIGISTVNYISVKKGAQPPDQEHAYGHEKIESLASYTQGMVILLFAFLILGETFRRSVASSMVLHSGIALGVILLAVAVNFILTTILNRAERETGSLILKAEKAHYLMDILSYVLVFCVILLVKLTGWNGWDLLGGILLAIYVGFLASRILLQAGNELVDRSLSKHALDELDAVIKHHSGVKNYHELRTRKAGSRTFIDFHLEISSKQSFEAAHETTESLIEKIKAKFPDSDILVHEDPEGAR